MEYADWGGCGVYGVSWHIIFALRQPMAYKKIDRP